LSTSTPETDLLDEIALPSRLGVALGREIWGLDWKPYPFILEIEQQVVAACVDETSQDWFIINLPNQVGKTSWAGVLLIFWYIGMFPDKQVIFISYSDDYSRDYGRVVRDLFKRHGERLFGLTVDPANDSAGDWKLRGHPAGGMLSVGIGGQITGRQGHLVVIDDVLRTMVDAASAAVKDSHWKEWQGAIYGRRQPGSVYLVTATRLAEDDLTGRLLAQQRQLGTKGLDWKHLIFPGICEPPREFDGPIDEYRDTLGRAVGEPLECRFTRPVDTVDDNWFTQARDALDNPSLFDCMVQQNPQRNESGMFPPAKWKYALRDDWPPIFNKVRAWDPASTKGGGDYTTGSLLGRAANGDIYVFGRIRERLGSGDVIEKVKATASSDGAATPILVEEERSGAGKNIVEFFRRELMGFQVHPAKAEGTKEQRATPYSTLQQGGHVWLPADDADVDWVNEWVKEHASVMGDGRRGRHDDQVDTGAYAVNWLLDNGIVDLVDPNDADLAAVMRMDDMLTALGY
jgi:predicted phage terminase large subunit-like protein